MSKSLVIVESPAKTKTLKKILGPEYDIRASMGHVRDLPKSRMAIDVENGFTPEYQIIPDKRKVIAELRDAASKAATVYLATDPDREGEAIAWHLEQALKLEGALRIQFNEITVSAVREAIRAPRTVNTSLVDAQQARRVLDRLVGYKLSPLLWKKVKRGTSAGRVQSVAVRLICDREREIEAFVPEEYWTITALVTPEEKRHEFEAKFVGPIGGKALRVRNEEQANEVLKALQGARWFVGEVRKRERRVKAAPPFITSTLQQEASRRLGMSNKRAMAVAQQLYEGVDVGDEGSVGLITYMRTDSTRVAREAQDEARAYIARTFGDRYVPGKPPVYSSRSGAQDAHEAIRPTSVMRSPDSIRQHLTSEQARLYELIWKRFLASQMEAGVDDVTDIDVHAVGEGRGHLFRASGSTVKFDGYRVLYSEARDEDAPEEEAAQRLPAVKASDPLELLKLTPTQRFTEPPPRYSPATLVKALEENGVGRPSTYATIVSTIQDRGYVELKEKRFHPTALGFAVNDLLVAHFHRIVDVRFTAGMEEDLDRVAVGQRNWVTLIADFYGPFEETLQRAETEAERVKLPVRVLEGEACPECGAELHIRQSRFGEFIGCSRYPDCRYTRPLTEKLGMDCPRPGCTGELLIKKGKSKAGKNYTFYGCSTYPQCTFTTFDKPIADRPCEACGYPMGENRMGRRLLGYRCTNRECPTNAAADASHEGASNGADAETPPDGKAERARTGRPAPVLLEGQTCPECGAGLAQKTGRYGPFVGCSAYPKCRYIRKKTA